MPRPISLARFFTCLVLIFCVITVSSPAQSDNSFCWKANFGRGVGTLPKACPNGYSQELAACYTTCSGGYEAYSPGAVTCEQKCPSGWTDNPGTCLKPAPTSSAGYPWKLGDTPFDYTAAGARCRAANQWGCYQSGLIWYPNCATGYHKVGDLVCSPDCPTGMSDGGVFCSKMTYTRAMTVPGCSSGMEKDGALCYPSCGNGFDGEGPVCWSQCPSDHPVQCGAACAVSASACQSAVGDMVTNTVSAALTIASFAFGGPGAFTGLRAGIKAARAVDVAEKAATTGESVLMTAARTYTREFGQKFATTMMKGAVDNKNLYFRLAQKVNGEVGSLNRTACEFGAQKDTGGFDLNDLSALDPTGVASMVTSFTKYGACTSNQFSVDRNELNFGDITSQQKQTFTIIAQRPTTITRIATPAMNGTVITPSADCLNRPMLAAETCLVTVAVQGYRNLDAEVRIYSDVYTSVPLAVHVTGNPKVASADSADPTIDEAMNLTDVQGVWAYQYDQSKKVQITGDGRIFFNQNTDMGSGGTIQPAGNAGHGFMVNTGYYQGALTLNDAGDRLTNVPLSGAIHVKGSPYVLSLDHYRTDNGTAIILWKDNQVLQQQFFFQPLSDGSYKIVSNFSGKVFHATSNSGGASIIETDFTNSPGDKFRIEAVGNGTSYRIVNVASHLALTLASGINTLEGVLVQSEYSDLDSQHFVVSMDYGNFVRRPWDRGCNPGETNFAGLCYDVPYGYSMTLPGVMGQVCPKDWRDDGITCWPVWTGAAIPAQADPNGGDAMRHPILVTDTRYNSQSCPANFYNSGGFTCAPITQGKGLTIISGHVPH